MKYTFSRDPLGIRHSGITPEYATQDLIEATPTLRRASLSNAALFGGPLIRRALESAPIVGDRTYVVVDTKVTFLMPTWYPAIPGWHTDGVPRGRHADPTAPEAPSMTAQVEQSEHGYFPRFHTLILGVPCLTKFVRYPLQLDLQHGEDPELYTEMTHAVEAEELSGTEFHIPDVGHWASWDWWHIHTATPARERGWRLLVRIAEGNSAPPADEFLRPQTQVYVPQDFGW